MNWRLYLLNNCIALFKEKTDMVTTIYKLEADKAGLQEDVSDLKRSCKTIEKRAAEQKVIFLTYKIKCRYINLSEVNWLCMFDIYLGGRWEKTCRTNQFS